jgi:ribosomal protein L13
MKNLLRIIILTIITIFIFSSCGKQMSITKRKYNKGYYVSHSHKRGDVKSQPATAAVKHEKPEHLQAVAVKLDAPTKHAEEEIILTAAVSKPLETQNNPTPASKTDVSGNKFAKKFYQVKQLEKILPSQLYTTEVRKKLSADHDHSHDALSFLWVIIVVILILYLLGILFDGFGLGGLIHLLALVIVVLLILWLLRIL